jgi:Fe2+ transport system protein FeoA
MTEIRSQMSEIGKAGRRTMTKKISFLALCSLFLAPCSAVEAQQTGKIFRIGFLNGGTSANSAVLVEALRRELSKLGWIEGKNITIEYRFAGPKAGALA